MRLDNGFLLYLCRMKRLLFILPLLTLLASCTPQVETTEPTVPDTVPELVEGPFQASPALSTIDSLMWHQLDSAFALLLQFAGSPEADSLDTFNMNYFQVLLSELLYKNDCAQSNRNELLQAVACFDSLSSALNAHPFAPSRHSGPDPESPSPYDDLPFLAARAHYINGVGYYESDSLVPACAEYLKALEVMEDRYKEKELVGHKARFMAYTYSRLGELFSSQFMAEQAIDCFKEALLFCEKEPTSIYGASVLLYNIGIQFDVAGQKDSAEYYCMEALNCLPDTDNLHYRDIVTTKGALAFNRGCCADSVINDIKQVMSAATDEDEKLSRMFTIGCMFFGNKQNDSARRYLEPVFEKHADVQTRIPTAENLRNICQEEGDTAGYLLYSEFLAGFTLTEFENKNTVSQLNDQYQSHVSQNREKKRDKERDKAVRKTICVLSVVAVVVGIAIFIIVRRRMKAKTGKMLEDLEKERLEHRNKQAALSGRLKKSNEELRKLKEENQKQTNNSLKEQEVQAGSFIDEPVCRLILGRVNEGKSLSQMDFHVYKDYALDKEQVLALQEAANRHFDQFTVCLKHAYPQLTNGDLDYCCFYLLGLTDADISALMQKAYPTVSQRSRKIKAILGSESPLPITLRGFADNIQR